MRSMTRLLVAAVMFVASGPFVTGAVAHDLATASQYAPGAQPARPAQGTVLFRNVRIFDGTSGTISAPSDVLVRGNRIGRIAAALAPEPGARVIDGAGRVLMPGLIDMHWHSMMAAASISALLNGDQRYLSLVAGAESERTLMRGFTTVRDLGGNVFGLKQAVDEGVLPGPRIFPSGAMISVTSGHGDFRRPGDLPRKLGTPGPTDLEGDTAIADSPDEVRLRVREQLMRGASQIKLTAGGGVSSPHSPLDVITFTGPELRAAVEAAANWGTYVTVHAYTAEAIRQAIDAGVKVIEHGSLMDEDTARLMARQGIWLSIQPFAHEMAEAFAPGSFERAKAEEVFAGNDRAYALAKKHHLKTAFGTDVLFSGALAARQGAILASLTRWYTPAEALVMATGTNGELLKLSGKRSPYPGELGVVREGALADLLLVDGDPTVDLTLVARPEQSFRIIMKDGVIYKDTLAR